MTSITILRPALGFILAAGLATGARTSGAADPATAEPLLSPPVAERATYATTSPEALLRDTTDRLLADLASDRARSDDPGARSALVRAHVAAHIDFDRIGQRVLGPHWRSATSNQRERFVRELEQMVYRAFSELLAREEDIRIDFGPARGAQHSAAVSVRSTLHAKARKPMDVRFRLESSPSGWKLYDVVIEGVSLVTTYRVAFDITVRESGVDGLIESLAAKNRTLGERDQS